jgi:hypothetical protein
MTEFEWDDVKSAENLAKHGLSFEEAARIFQGFVLTNVDDREDYREVREISLGLLEGLVVLCVAHTEPIL